VSTSPTDHILLVPCATKYRGEPGMKTPPSTSKAPGTILGQQKSWKIMSRHGGRGLHFFGMHNLLLKNKTRQEFAR